MPSNDIIRQFIFQDDVAITCIRKLLWLGSLVSYQTGIHNIKLSEFENNAPSTIFRPKREKDAVRNLIVKLAKPKRKEDIRNN